MPPKKGKKGKGKKAKAVDPNKMPQVDRTFYELTITDLNQKLARLRSHLHNLEEKNINIAEKLRELEEDHTDVAAYLERTLADRNEYILEIEERLTEIIKIRETEKREAAEKIKDLEAKYKGMHDQLTSEIKLLNGKLNSLDEFRITRDILLAKFEDQEIELAEKDRAQKELLFQMEQKAIVEKDALKKEIEAKLLQVSEDFTRSSEIRNAGYTRRLIRENIALQKEIDKLVFAQIKIQKQLEQQVVRYKEMENEYDASTEIKMHLIRTSQNKIHLIEKMTNNYERMKTKCLEMSKYKKLYETLMKKEMCDRFNFNDVTKRMHSLNQVIENLKQEKGNMLLVELQQQEEIKQLNAVLDVIKTTVLSAISITTQEYIETEEAEGDRMLKKRDMMSQLLNIIYRHTESVKEQPPSIYTPSRSNSTIYRPGKLGLVKRSTTSLFELFKCDVRQEEETIDSSFNRDDLKTEESKIIPKPIGMECNSMIDVELGSILYMSSSRVDFDGGGQDEEPVEVEGEASEYESSVSVKQSSEKATTASTSVHSPKPLASSHSTPQEQSNLGTEFAIEEDEEAYSINLFY
ncbi:cilia- and flagella-associated protein 157 [Teleopsis dalmanni]|uniref:cilia- and flagella-associated protein 157 n=1 Tax=Teleopsis dalmanni TaxID=139649 RepID=UPI0018CD4D86|nr:cilia- and flagella-associated protein 157 [Teleopsis dalmanni]